MFESWLENAKVIRAEYKPSKHTFELEYQPAGSLATQVALLTKDFFPKHPGFLLLDENVKIHELVKVILRSEKELEYLGYKLDEKKKKMLAHPDSKFLIGKKKKQMLGNVYNARVGISEQLEPYVFIDRFRFAPNEIACVLKDEDLKVPADQKPIQMASKNGNFGYDPERRRIMLPSSQFEAAGIADLVKFLKKIQVV